MAYGIVSSISVDYCEALYRLAIHLQVVVSVYQRASRAAHTHSHVFHTQVIVFYDTLLTSSREVECIWKRKWSATAALFLVNRYSAVLVCMLDLFNDATLHIVRSVIYDSSQGTDSCRGLQIFVTFIAIGIQSLSYSCKSWTIAEFIYSILQLLSVAGSSLRT